MNIKPPFARAPPAKRRQPKPKTQRPTIAARIAFNGAAGTCLALAFILAVAGMAGKHAPIAPVICPKPPAPVLAHPGPHLPRIIYGTGKP